MDFHSQLEILLAHFICYTTALFPYKVLDLHHLSVVLSVMTLIWWIFYLNSISGRYYFLAYHSNCKWYSYLLERSWKTLTKCSSAQRGPYLRNHHPKKTTLFRVRLTYDHFTFSRTVPQVSSIRVAQCRHNKTALPTATTVYATDKRPHLPFFFAPTELMLYWRSPKHSILLHSSLV